MELLCPAGNTQNLKSAIANGADAVYLGSKNFSARNYADNFENLYSVIEYIHKHNVKAYIALNTLVNDRNIKNWLKTAYDSCNADAFIVQDLGCAMLLKKHLPNIPLHSSTQMTVHNLSSAKTLKYLGFSRIILPRELTYDEIKYIALNCGIETEVFVHGAICYSYSGQCLMSSIIGARSANQGVCAQPCRLKYSISNKNGYLLNTKDLCLLEEISMIKSLGVASVKIEGRMKNPFYTGVTAKLYKKAINSETISSQDKNMLNLTFNRGFTKGMFFKDSSVFAKNLTKTKDVNANGYLKILNEEIAQIQYSPHFFEIDKIVLEKSKKKPLLAMQVNNQLQAKAVEQYADFLYIPIDSNITSSKKCVGVYPSILNDKDVDYYKSFENDEILISSFLETDKIKYGDISLNVMNCHTLNVLKNLGFKRATLSTELTARQIKDMQVKGIQTEVMVYGRQTLMTSVYCPINCDKKQCFIEKNTCLKDRTGAEFPIIRNKKNCGISILNSIPLFIADKIYDIIADVYRVVFTTESDKECAKIAKIYAESLITPVLPLKSNFTRGHFYRGVT